MSLPTWWLVMTRPAGDTTEPDPPVEKRTAAFCSRSNSAGLPSKPYFALSASAGMAFGSHIPSSARMVAAAIRHKQVETTNLGRSIREG